MEAMKAVAVLAVTTLGVALGTAPWGRAQEDDSMGPPDGVQGLRQAFGPGNGIRGTVTAVAANAFTIKTDEGVAFRVFYSPNTRLVKDRQPMDAADVHIGDMLLAGGLVDSKAKTVGAVLVVDIDAKQVQEARASFGKTWLIGKVTDVHGVKITVERADDKQTEVVAVDENTSFRKHREEVTLADVKVGDTISSEGAIRDNTFVASILRIMPPKAQQPAGLGQPVQ
jgi:Domain of unknown function (DUF5666)